MPEPRTPTPQGASTAALLSWSLFDWANSAFPTVIQTFVFAAYFTRQVAESQTAGSAAWGTAIGVAGAFIALGGPILGAIADQGARRKPWIAVLSGACVVATACLWFVEPGGPVLPALVLLAVGVVTFELACVFYNAMLPELAGTRIGRWSGWAWGLGYAGGLASLVVCLFALVRPEGAWLGLDAGEAEHVRATFLLVALWFALFSLPLFLVTPDRARPAGAGAGRPVGAVRAVRDGLAQLVRTLREIRRHGAIVRFLVARMLYIDGLATLFSFGGVYAAGTFDMTEQEVLGFGIALNVTAGLGAALFAWLDDHLGSKGTILMALAGLLATGVPILLVETETLFWVLGVALGTFVGPAQAASRSYLAHVAPPDLRTQMFGLYALSGKATAFAGPLLVGWITVAAGSQRVGMSVIMVFLALGGLLMLTVPGEGE
ncbi:MAG: MFS transporter [Acidobacteriota bacterium]|jgi:UMF1 family MFS transporter